MSDPAVIAPQQAPCPSCGYLADSSAGFVNYCPKCGMDMRGASDDDRTLTHALVGQVIADRYRLITLLGEGGMGSVYKAEHIRMGKALAVKLLRGSFAREPGTVARFRTEAQIVSRLSHPHTIGVFDFGAIGGDDGGFYLAMEYVPGKDLATVLREQRRLPEARVAAVAEQLLGSLAEAHDAGIVHRDIKPGNVMLMETRSGGDFVKVLDFGIAKLRDAPGATTSDTSVGAIVGTPNYLSPEQARGEALDARADLYSVGALLYELVSGRCPFVYPNPLAVVSAHLSERPPQLTEVAPEVSREFASIVHRALEKRPGDRFASADAMREALLRLGEPTTRRPPRIGPSVPDVTGGLRIAHREDFAELERQIHALKRSRIAAPLAVAGLLALAGLAAWRWDDVYALLRARTPSLAGSLPAAFRPSELYDGEEHEPNDSPAQANPLPVPPGPDGRRGGGVAEMRGHIGARLSETTGDVDVYRIEVPRVGRPVALHAEWRGERPGDGIPGLDVALTLSRERSADGSGVAALISSVDRGGPGRPEELVAAVAPGTYDLAVREKHAEGAAPTERPGEAYRLRVWLAEPQAGEEIEPNDAPDPVEHAELRYPEWREVASRNTLGEGRPIRGTTSAEDPDTYAVAPRSSTDASEVVAVAPEPRLGVAAQLWVPDAADLAPKAKDRVRFEKAGAGAAGEVLFVRLPAPPFPRAPLLLQLRASAGEGRYDVVALGQGLASASAVVALLDALERDGRGVQGLELAAGFLRLLPGAPSRGDVLLAAGKLAERLAASPPGDLMAASARAAQLLGDPIFEVSGASRVRYAGAFEALVEGRGRAAEEASFRLIARASPCTAGDVARRASFFLERFPASALAPDARLWLARASEDELFLAGGGKDALRRAVDAYRSVARGRGEGAVEAQRRLHALTARRPQRATSPRVVCR